MPIFQNAAVIAGQTLVVADPTPVMTPVTTASANAALASVASAEVREAPISDVVSPGATVATTPAVNQIRFVDPELARGITNLRPIFNGTTRDKLSVPVAPAPDFNDDVLFQDPADPTKHFYLPRYAVAQDTTAGGKP